MKNLFNGNNTCTYKKCPKSVRNLYAYVKKKTENINASIKKINTKDKFDKLYDKYDNLLNNIKTRKLTENMLIVHVIYANLKYLIHQMI